MKKMIALLSSLVLLSTCSVGLLSVQAAHTFETRVDEWTDEKLEEFLDRSSYYQDDDGVFYSLESGGDWIWDAYVPNDGTYDRALLLLALLKKYPEARFAVQLQCWGDEGISTPSERERLRQNGIEVTEIDSIRWYTILDAEQLKNFPVDENYGYFIGLAAKPLQSGDINMDDKTSLSDVVMLNKHLMIGEYIAPIARDAADVDKNGEVDEIDSLNILKSVIGLVDLEELG